MSLLLNSASRLINLNVILFLCAFLAPQIVSAQAEILEEGDDWKFFRGTEEPPENWKEIDFDDSAWEDGITGIGYGDEDDSTILEDMQNNYLSVYLRKEITISEEHAGSQFRFQVRFDDGYVAYVDGEEVGRRRLTGEPPAFNEAAYGEHEITNPNGFDENFFVTSETGFLAPGTHVIAVQVHNVALTSSDLSFALEVDVNPFYLDSVSPRNLKEGEQRLLTIAGVGFQSEETYAVRFGDVAAGNATVVSSQELQIQTPAGLESGSYTVVVESDQGVAFIDQALRIGDSQLSGLEFDGNNGNPAGATATELAGFLEEGTIELHFARNAGGFLEGLLWRSLFAIQGEGGQDAVVVDVQGGNVRVRIFEGGEDPTTLQGAFEVGTAWHHLAFSFDQEGRSLFVDGQLVASSAEPLELSSSDAIRFGSNFAGGYGLFYGPLLGRIESARVWDHARNAEELGRFAFNPLDGDDFVAAWNFSEGEGQTSADLSPDSRNLILGDSAGVDERDPTWVELADFPFFVISDVDPAQGSNTGGEHVRIYGNGLDRNELRVFFGEAEAEILEIVSPWEILIQTPEIPSFGLQDVRLQAAGDSVSLPGAFDVQPENFEVVIAEGDIWHYSVDQQPGNWNSLEFNAVQAGWQSGPTGLGYGDGDDATEVLIQGSSVALYARHVFEFTGDADQLELLILKIRFDDGFVAYLNGEEITRQGLVGVPPAFDELAEDHEITGPAGTFDITIDLLQEGFTLLEGDNVLAIEVHNGTLDSSDLSLSAELSLSEAGPVGTGRPFIRGDLDEDGSISITDCVRGLLVIFTDFPLTCSEAADVQNDGKINILDPIHILDYLFHNGVNPAAPFPEPGLDIDEDAQDCPEL